MAGVWAIIVAAGWGERFGGPKQFSDLGSSRLVDHAVATASAACDAVVVVVPEATEWHGAPVAAVVRGGATRAESVRAGLAAVAESADIVVVHDAARPLAGLPLFATVIAAVREGADGAVPGLPVADTLKRVDDVRITATVDRVGLVAVQTPQAFRADVLRAAHGGRRGHRRRRACRSGRRRSRGGPGRSAEPEGHRARRSRHRRRAPGCGAVSLRVGLGYDVHAFAPNRKLVLGGVELDGEGLAGHSDADVVAHAVADALLGPAGLPDLGALFPASDDRYRDASSLDLLRDVVARISAAGWSVVNVDVVIAAERPHLAAHLAAIAANLSAAIGGAFVSAKPKRGEGIGMVGRGEGIACWAVALLEGT